MDIDLGLEDAIKAKIKCVHDRGFFILSQESDGIFFKISKEGHDANHCAIVVSDVKAVAGTMGSLGPTAVVVLAPKEKGYAAVEGGFKPGACLGLPDTSQIFKWGVSCPVVDGGILKVTTLLGEFFKIGCINFS